MQVWAFVRMADTVYIFLQGLRRMFCVFLKSVNLKKLITSPKDHSTVILTFDMAALKAAWSGVMWHCNPDFRHGCIEGCLVWSDVGSWKWGLQLGSDGIRWISIYAEYVALVWSDVGS